MATFKQLEHAGWTEKAASYDDHFAEITRQAIDPLLDSLGGIADRDLIDICCGTGDLAAAAVSSGARVTGIDFAETMIAAASAKVPDARFATGDAEALDFEASSFDHATCAFGLWHLADPDAAISEAARVLRPDGNYAFTTWLPPKEGWDMFDILLSAIGRHGTLEVDLPPAPPPFRFADEKCAQDTLREAGFADVTIQKHTATWVGSDGGDLLALLYKGIVRAPMLIDAQAPDARTAIRQEIKDRADAMKVDGTIKMRWPYLIATGRKSEPK